MIVGDIDMPRRRLPHRAHAKDHSAVLPALFIDAEHGHTGRRARQPRLQAAHCLFTSETMRDRNNKRCGHCYNLPLSITSCNSNALERKRPEDIAAQKVELCRFQRVLSADGSDNLTPLCRAEENI